MDKESVLEQILQRLNILIALQLEVMPDLGKSSIKQRIHKLAELGLGPAQIGSVLGKKANYVSAVIGSKEKYDQG